MLLNVTMPMPPTEQKQIHKPRRKLVIARPVFILTLVTMLVIITGVWLSGLKQHHPVFHNALFSTGAISIVFFTLLSAGLYQGVKLRDDLGKITDRINFKKLPDWPGIDLPIFDGDGIFGLLAAIILGILALVLLYFLGILVWMLTLLLCALLYRIFFRGLRYVFRHGSRCKGQLNYSVLYGIGYTVLYSCWIYGIIFALHYLVH